MPSVSGPQLPPVTTHTHGIKSNGGDFKAYAQKEHLNFSVNYKTHKQCYNI